MIGYGADSAPPIQHPPLAAHSSGLVMRPSTTALPVTHGPTVFAGNTPWRYSAKLNSRIAPCAGLVRNGIIGTQSMRREGVSTAVQSTPAVSQSRPKRSTIDTVSSTARPGAATCGPAMMQGERTPVS